MPITKEKRTSEPLWKSWDQKAQKSGLHHTVYVGNGDKYTGEWKDNKKHGKGSFYCGKSGSVYHGDWKDGLRHGYGTYGVVRSGVKVKEYDGGWKFDKRHGHGTRYYDNSEYYEGEWYADKRSGWGRMFYSNGSVYEGEWLDDQRSGNGMLRLENDNRYEGHWSHDMKNGPGKFYYLDKGQLCTGIWKDDIAKCSTFEDYGRSMASDPNTYIVPVCQLKDANAVLNEASQAIYNIAN